MTDKPLKPLMSDRSPSYERAQAGADAVPVAGAQVVALLSRLWEAEENAAVALPDDATSKRHRANQAELAALIVAHGGSPPRENEARDILGTTPAKVPAALAAEYQKAIASPHLDDALRAALAKCSHS